MRSVIVAIVIAALSAACGGGDDGASDDPRASDLAEVLAADTELELTETEATCTAAAMVADLDDASVDTLLDGQGLDLAALAGPEEAVDAFDAYLDCVDLEQKMVDSLLDDGTPEETARCIAQSFGEGDLRTILGASVLPGGAVDEEAAFNLVGEVFEAAEACFAG